MCNRVRKVTLEIPLWDYSPEKSFKRKKQTIYSEEGICSCVVIILNDPPHVRATTLWQALPPAILEGMLLSHFTDRLRPAPITLLGTRLQISGTPALCGLQNRLPPAGVPRCQMTTVVRVTGVLIP